jgi:hypothetical protein
MLALTNVDKALLKSEFVQKTNETPLCPCCWVPPGTHRPDCEMDLALAERGFPDQHARDTARASFK